ncbi:restriction endonuclease subunit S [Aeromonas allosaccharophila]|uniref:restriction endonuclease subunit S n=1 Tax=Aeromonas TaxID=642 RepID=UPI001BCC6E97|nr:MULTISPECIES: restriction endonuclease subunit S [Aeromonas]MBS4697333.1 restriction endonuclease subunit S [Aeromonas allosaccharophila]MBS4705626.1 restriction endonuclease subunit S [Aeromonas veronii]
MAEQMMQEAAGKAIPAGYQQTEVGAIPEDWEAIPLGGICKVQGGFAFKSEKFKKTGVPILRISNIQSGFLDVNEVVYYAVGEKIPKQFEVHDGDALIAMSGATTGKVGVYNKNEVAYLNQRVGKFVLYGNADMKYIQHVVGSDLYKSALSNMLEQGAQPNISSSQLERIIIRKPTLEIEQKIIANVLSDSDALIDALERLIAKKQAIKSGTMQQLLTGRTRLPAFALRPDGTKKGYKPSELGDIPEDWEVIPLGDICSLYQPVTISGSELKESGYPVYGANGLIGFYEKYNHEAPQVIVTCRGSTCGTVNYTVAKSWITGNAMVVDVDKNKKLDKNFTYYMLSNQDLTVCITGSGQPQIVRSPLAAFKVVLPEIEEQTAIATILSDMDNELQALTQKLEKARALKQGMMQQLLTGKIRLPLAAGA